MAHINIIQVSGYPVEKENYIDETDLYDSFGSVDPLLADTEYYGDPVVGEKRKNALEQLKKAMEPYALVDVNTGIIQFRDTKTVKESMLEKIEQAFQSFKKHFQNNEVSMAEYQLRLDTRTIGVQDLFYGSYCQNFSTVAADYLAGYTPKTLYVGAILDVKI